MKVKTILKRYYRWKLSGPITVISVLLVGILGWHFITVDIPFYDKFTCPQMMEYKGGDYGVSGQPDYKDLTDEQKQKYDVEYQKCIGMGWQPKS